MLPELAAHVRLVGCPACSRVSALARFIVPGDPLIWPCSAVLMLASCLSVGRIDAVGWRPAGCLYCLPASGD